MSKLKNLTALLFVALLLVAGACGQDENFQEVEQTIEKTYDPKENGEDNPPSSGG